MLSISGWSMVRGVGRSSFVGKICWVEVGHYNLKDRRRGGLNEFSLLRSWYRCSMSTVPISFCVYRLTHRVLIPPLLPNPLRLTSSWSGATTHSALR